MLEGEEVVDLVAALQRSLDAAALVRVSAYTFTGHRRDGVAVAGRTEESPAAFAERMYHAGYRDLRIKDADAEHVGGIHTPPETGGTRTWWGQG